MNPVVADARRILICLRYGIGDVVMETPAIEELARSASKARITALGAEPAIQLLQYREDIREVASIQDFGLEHWQDPGAEPIRLRIRDWLEECDFDVVMDVSHAVAAVREAIWKWDGAYLMDSDGPDPDPVFLAGGRGFDALRRHIHQGWGILLDENAFPRIRLHESELSWARQRLSEWGLAGKRPAAVSPVGSCALKRWPEERLAEMADQLARMTGLPVLVFGGPQNDETDRVIDAMRQPDKAVRVGETHLRSTAALLSLCGVFVCNDTGLMHMAAAVGTPTAALFGPTSPRIYLPPNRAVAACPTRPCRFRRTNSFGPSECLTAWRCLRDGPESRGCIEEIEVEDAMAAVVSAAASPEMMVATNT